MYRMGKTTAGWFTQLILNFADLRDLFGVETNLKESMFQKISLLQPEHDFCQQNGAERGQVQDWYPNEKMMVVPICLSNRCCSSGRMGILSY